MTLHASKPAWSWLLAVGLLALLLILASLQYRWLDEVSRADREKTRDVLQTAVERFAEDFDREVTRAFLYFQPSSGFRVPPAEVTARGMERWQASAPYPDLVRAVFQARPAEDGSLELARFDPASASFVDAGWPTELEELRRELEGGARPRRFGDDPPGPSFSILADRVPALVLPMISFPPPDGPPPMGRGATIVWLDLETITTELLPRLTERHLLAGEDTSYHVRIVALEDQRLVFDGGAAMDGAPTEDGDASARLFALLPPEKLRTAGLEPGWPHPQEGGPGRRFGDGRRLHRFYQFISQEETGRWRLVASHPAGSLEAAVARAHRRNLVISFGILLLLAASLLLILLSTRRLQALARQQLEFIAGVTHELLTPLAAMRSAGQNLADGVVAEPEQVKRYGALVEDEGRRLSRMVEQVLEFAGMQAGRQTYSLARTSSGEVLAAALAEYQPMLEEKGFEVEERIEEPLPEVMADASALRRAIQNLIANALKYGTEGAWIRLGARAGEGSGGRELLLSVEDRGPGIAAKDLPHLFEPFYRGSNGSGEPIPGSGLGLSLVKHIVEGHGGRVEVATAEGEGSRFTIHVPAVGEQREAGGDEP
ncbi:MAG: HAMP domain-containing histidine kinase [bacterium]|nr:HAMP domain-containing histidine kinase [bacterium]